MRFTFRYVLAASFAAAISSCVDGTPNTAPSAQTRASLAIVPRFSESAAVTSATLAETGSSFDHVRIVIVRPANDTLKDTVIVFSPASEELTMELSVAAVPDESLVAGLQFTQGTTVLFSGASSIKSVGSTQAGSATPVEVKVEYTGPGAATKKVTIQPGSGIYSASGVTQFSAKAFDASNVELPNTSMTWTVSHTDLATISASGALTPKGSRGSLRVRAVAPNGVADSVNVELAPAAVSLRISQGASQIGTAGSVLPIPVVIQAIDAQGLPAPGGNLVATFTASGNAQISPSTVAFDANGRATATMTLGTTPGVTYIYKVTAGGFDLSWAGIARVGAPTQFIPSGPTTLSMTAGVVPNPVPTLRVADADGNSVPGMILKVTIQKNGVNVISPFFAPADSIGLLEVHRVAPTVAGTYTVRIETDPSFSVPSITYTITIEPGAAVKLGFLQSPSGVVANQTVPSFSVAIQDEFGNTVPTASGSVSLAIDPAGVTGWAVTGTTTVSTASGVATFSNVQFTTSTGAKTDVKIRATAAGLAAALSAAFNITP
jgi:hypothetical protein